VGIKRCLSHEKWGRRTGQKKREALTPRGRKKLTVNERSREEKGGARTTRGKEHTGRDGAKWVIDRRSVEVRKRQSQGGGWGEKSEKLMFRW